MATDVIEKSAVDLAWSLWTELGVPGVIRNHQRACLDPEPLIASSPVLARLDPRLRDQMFGWCRTHATRISASRLQSLVPLLPANASTAFVSFSATLRTAANVRWPSDEATEPWPRVPEPTKVRAPELSPARPALLRFRLRALCGVGTRADVLSELLARQAWSTASELADEGYTKRNVARVLSELEEAGIVRVRTQANARQFQLADRGSVTQLVQAEGLSFPPWRSVFQLVLAALELAQMQARPPAVRRVEAHKLRQQLALLANAIELDPPPQTTGVPDAWDVLVAWSGVQLRLLASGTAPIMVA